MQAIGQRLAEDISSPDQPFLPNDVSDRIIQTHVVGGGAMAREHFVAKSDTTAQLGRGTPNDLREVAEGDIAWVEAT